MHKAGSDNRTWQGARLIALCVPLLLIVGLSQPALAAAGALDTTFGTAGTVTTDFGSYDGAASVALQSDGKIVAAGGTYIGSNQVFALARYETNGSLDTSFGGTGKVTTPIGSASGAASVAIQSNGKIVAAGSALIRSRYRFALARYNTDGSLDTSFSGDGKLFTPISSDALASSVAIHNGKIVAAGYADNGSNTVFALARYNTNGSLDTSFSGNGKVTTPIGSGASFATSVAIQPNGRIVTAGYADNGSNTVFALARYNTNGSLDTSFSGNGKVTTPIGSSGGASSVAIQPNGRIVAAGNALIANNSRFALARYKVNGSLDTSFSGTGKVTTPIGSGASASSVAIQLNGRIIAAGQEDNGSNVDFALARYKANGSLDPSFGSTGKVTTQIGSYAGAIAVAIQSSDGRIVAAGYANNGTDDDFTLARYDG